MLCFSLFNQLINLFICLFNVFNRLNLKTTRIAFGIPADSGILYTDPITLKRAFNGRLPASKINLN